MPDPLPSIASISSRMRTLLKGKQVEVALHMGVATGFVTLC